MSGSSFFATTLALIGLARYPWIPARQLGHSQVGDDETEGLLLEGRERCQAIHGFDDRAGELAHEHPPQHRSRRRFVVNDQVGRIRWRRVESETAPTRQAARTRRT
jgi:hypothetical protein